jgi:Raf kinase inhibitor-like YbhB/YbcL family protein
MKRRVPLMLAALLISGGLLVAAGTADAAGLRLASPDLAAAQFAPRFLFDGDGCGGGNVSPGLAWSDPPSDARSFAVTLYDLDAPTGHGWWHWVVYDIPAAARSLPTGAGAASGRQLPPGARQTRNDFGAPGYGGPCPPPGKPHRYVFTLYALDAPALGAAPELGPAEIGARLKARALATASFTVAYGQP